ncbi:MAG: O-methyltransferase family 3, partial [Verrucomicrobiaceae bacterium]|nr:O-methyltransferase family 3 [Verrucomicrobiaceae bacterium]
PDMPWQELPEMKPFLPGGRLVDAKGEQREVHSASTSNNLTVLQHWFQKLQPARTLEIGLAFGASATLLLALHRRVGHTGVCHHSVDPFQRTDWNGCALRHIGIEGLADLFAHHEALSCFALPKLHETSERFGLIYIDGSHLFEDVMVDFYFSNLLLEIGGVIAFDDSACGHVKKVTAFIRSNWSASYSELSPYEVTAPRWPRLKQTVARWTNRQQLTLFQKVEAPKRDWNTEFGDF